MGFFSRLAEPKPQWNYSSTAVTPPASVYRSCCHNANLRRHTVNTNPRDTPEGIPCRKGRLEADHGYVKHPSWTNDKRARWFVSKRVNAFWDIDPGTGGLLRNHNLLENLLDVIARDWKSRSVVHEETNREWGALPLSLNRIHPRGRRHSIILHRVYVRGRCAANRDVTVNSLGAVNWIVRWEHGGVGA